MMAAGRAAECGARVLLLEKTPRLGNKLRLTGKGRSNITNESDLAEFVAHFGKSGPFLYGAFARFFVQDLISFFNARGVSTTVERGGRVFPVSNDARQVVAALEGYLATNGVEVRFRSPVDRLLIEGGRIHGVEAKGRVVPCAAAVLATGGASYPRTGSTGDGYRLAAEVGHRIVPVRPALVPLVLREPWVCTLQGLSLRHVLVTALLDGRPMAQEFGEMVFTHYGVSGPTILTLSRRVVDALAEGQVVLSVNLKPALTAEELDRSLQGELEELGRKHLRNVLASLMPKRMTDVFVMLLGISGEKPAHRITSSERKRLRALLQDLRLTVDHARPVAEAIVTAGGVATEEINPRTMESRLIEGLFFCGEVIDVDADTGGYNLQAAFSTGYLAGEASARSMAASAVEATL
jgi:predicted Rossmann fold flavoprotein